MEFPQHIQMRFLSYHCDNFLRIYYQSVLKQLLEQAKLTNEKFHRYVQIYMPNMRVDASLRSPLIKKSPADAGFEGFMLVSKSC